MKRAWVPQIVISGMLLWALNPGNPYAYYVLLRWVCCAVFAYLAFEAFALQKQSWVWVLGVTAAVYNPLIPVYLTREIWSVINVVTVGLALASIFAVKARNGRNLAALQPNVSGKTILRDVVAILDDLDKSLNCEAFQVIRNEIEQLARAGSQELSLAVSAEIPLRQWVVGCVANLARDYLVGNTPDVRCQTTSRLVNRTDLETIYDLAVDELAERVVRQQEAALNDRHGSRDRMKNSRIRVGQFLQDAPEQFKVLHAVWTLSSDALCHRAENVYREVDHPLPHGPCVFEVQVYLVAEILDQMVSFDHNEETIKRFHQFACHAILYDLHPRLLVNDDLHQIALSRLNVYWDLRSSSSNWGELYVARVRQLLNHLSAARLSAPNRVQKVPRAGAPKSGHKPRYRIILCRIERRLVSA